MYNNKEKGQITLSEIGGQEIKYVMKLKIEN